MISAAKKKKVKDKTLARIKARTKAKKSPSLGSGSAGRAQKALRGRGKRLRDAMKKAGA